MRMHITAQGFDLTEDLRQSVMHEIARLVQSLDRPVNDIAVRLFDERECAARGLDKRCRVRVEFDDSRAIEDSDSEASFHDCVCEAFVKVMRAEQLAH
jgi:ribosome-associated translation inhibitor RaiA